MTEELLMSRSDVNGFNNVKLALAICLLMTAVASAAFQGEKQKPVEPDWSLLLPEDEGKAEVTLACSNCHGLKQLLTLKKTKSGWQASVRKMVATYQVPVDREDLPLVVGYLAKHFGESNPVEQAPINVNTGAAAALERLPGISAEKAQAIITCREANGSFASVDDLLRVKGIDRETLKKIMPLIRTKD